MRAGNERRFYWSFSAALLILVGVGVLSYQSLAQSRTAAARSDHTRQVLARSSDLFAAILDVESAQRGFVLSGNDEYLDPYRAGTEAAPKALDELMRLTIDNPAQQQRLVRLQTIIGRKLDYAREIVITRRRSGFEAAQGITLSGEGKRITDEIRQLLRELDGEEERLLLVREQAYVDECARASVQVIGGSAVAILVVAITAFLMIRNAGALRTTLAEIREQEWLQGSLASLSAVLREERTQ